MFCLFTAVKNVNINFSQKTHSYPSKTVDSLISNPYELIINTFLGWVWITLRRKLIYVQNKILFLFNLIIYKVNTRFTIEITFFLNYQNICNRELTILNPWLTLLKRGLALLKRRLTILFGSGS